jgi:predicted DCC family thiol-disulfide oxidoreductase YuxK
MCKQTVIFFDGVCNLCNGFVNFIFKFNPPRQMMMTSLQGKYAKEVLPQELLCDLDTVVYQRGNHFYSKSCAIIWILYDLSWLLRPLIIFLLLPSVIRDGIYQWISKNRYRFFGKKETCMLPTPEQSAHFLD